MTSSKGTTTGGSNTATVTATQGSATQFNVASSVTDPKDFTFSSISWGYFDGSGAFQGTGGSLGNSVTLALSGTAGKVLQLEFASTANPPVKKVFNVTLGAGQQNYTFDITGLGLVSSINFVSNTVGSVNYAVETKGLSYVPAVVGGAYDSSALSQLVGNPAVVSSHGTVGGSNTATVTSTQTSGSSFNVSSAVTDAKDFTFSSIPGQMQRNTWEITARLSRASTIASTPSSDHSMLPPSTLTVSARARYRRRSPTSTTATSTRSRTT